MAIKNRSQIIRESNISRFTPLMEKEDIITELFSSSTNLKDKEITMSVDKARVLSDILSSITMESITTKEMLENLYGSIDNDDDLKMISESANLIKIVHASGKYNILKNEKVISNKKIRKFSDTAFAIPINSPTKTNKVGKNSYYKFKNKYGLVSESYSAETNEVFTTESLIGSSKGKEKDNQIINSIDKDDNLIISRLRPNLSFIMIDNPNLRIGTKNSLELATFFNSLSTIELSKCIPFFNVEFILPSLVQTAGNNVYQTSTITQFLNGTPNKKDNVTNVFRSLSANFVREIDAKNEAISQNAVRTNMSAFTMPQTINSFDEEFVGHSEDKPLSSSDGFKRQNSIHDYTRPYMSIKSFSVNIAPTQGLMSFKTANLSLVLHDRTRMSEIAPFIKPDLFGSFGAELIITYGWSHMDGINKIKGEAGNPLGELLDRSKNIEKYIITNSSYNIDSTGQVNIDLSLAMRGPIDIKSVTISRDAKEKLKDDNIKSYKQAYEIVAKDISLSVKEDFTINIDQLLRKIESEISDYKSKKSKDSNLKLIAHLGSSSVSRLFKTNIKKFQSKKVNTSKDVEEIIKDFYFKKGNKQAKKSIFGKDDIQILITTKVEKSLKQGEVISESNNPFLMTYNSNSPSGTIGSETLKIKVIRYLKALHSYFQACYRIYFKYKKKEDTIVKNISASIISDIGDVDPFYNLEWIKEYYKVNGTKEQIKQAKKGFIPVKNLSLLKTSVTNTDLKTEEFISLGSLITGLIGSYVCGKGKFDEVQILSYTVNDNAALMSNMNIASFLIPIKDLKDLIERMFSNGTTMTIEGILTQIINQFVMSSTQICYGFEDMYKREGGVSKQKVEDKKLHDNAFNDRLNEIYKSLAMISEKELALKKVTFSMPKIRLMFDTFVSRENNIERTICKVSLVDLNDNPYKSINTLMSGVNNKGILQAAMQLNKAKSELTRAKNASKEVEKAKLEFFKKSFKIINELLGKEAVIKNGKVQKDKKGNIVYKINRKNAIIEEVMDNGTGTGTYRIIKGFQFNKVKSRIKELMPSMTYGTQNSAIIDANITTVNEAKLNAVYMTRANRGTDNKRQQVATQVKFAQEMPLRVMPSQASVTIFGCPFVDFGQYIFLDFETGTTVDNTYAITGIKHDFTPGKFTTSLTLSYGDVYGKYESSLNTLSKSLVQDYKLKIKEQEEISKREKEEKARLEKELARLQNAGLDPSKLVQITADQYKEISDTTNFKTPVEILGVKDVNEKLKSSAKLRKVKGTNQRLISVVADLAEEIYDAGQLSGKFEESELKVMSGYRDIAKQQSLWIKAMDKYREVLKKEAVKKNKDPSLITEAEVAFVAWRWTALPGASKHQLGTTFDLVLHKSLANTSENVKKGKMINGKMTKLGDTKGFEFVSESASIGRFPIDNYKKEPWHWECNIDRQLEYLRKNNKLTPVLEQNLIQTDKIYNSQLQTIRNANLMFKKKVMLALPDTLIDGRNTKSIKDRANKMRISAKRPYRRKKRKSIEEARAANIVINEIKKLKKDLKDNHLEKQVVFHLNEKKSDLKDYFNSKNNNAFKPEYIGLNNTGFSYNKITVKTYKDKENSVEYKVNNMTGELELYIFLNNSKEAFVSIDLIDKKKNKNAKQRFKKIVFDLEENISKQLFLNQIFKTVIFNENLKYLKTIDKINENNLKFLYMNDFFRNFENEENKGIQAYGCKNLVNYVLKKDIDILTNHVSSEGNVKPEYSVDFFKNEIEKITRDLDLFPCTKEWFGDLLNDTIEDGPIIYQLDEPLFKINLFPITKKSIDTRRAFYKTLLPLIRNISIEIEINKYSVTTFRIVSTAKDFSKKTNEELLSKISLKLTSYFKDQTTNEVNDLERILTSDNSYINEKYLSDSYKSYINSPIKNKKILIKEGNKYRKLAGGIIVDFSFSKEGFNVRYLSDLIEQAEGGVAFSTKTFVYPMHKIIERFNKIIDNLNINSF